MYYSRQQLDCQGEEASTSTAYERLRDLRLRANNKAASLENGKSPARRRSRTRFTHEETYHHHHHHHHHYHHLSRDIRSSNGAFLLDNLAKIHDFVNEIFSTNEEHEDQWIFDISLLRNFSFFLFDSAESSWIHGRRECKRSIALYFSFYFSFYFYFRWNFYRGRDHFKFKCKEKL